MRRLGPAALLVLLLAAHASRAQFYDLDGAYRCFRSPDPQCERELADRTPQTAPAPPPPPPSKPAEPGIGDSIAHVRASKASAKDIDLLARAAQAGDPRAVEVLAWCKLKGIGTPRDPLAAYWLYRQAAALEIPHARENQLAIFEHQLTSEQRQQVLISENSQKKP